MDTFVRSFAKPFRSNTLAYTGSFFIYFYVTLNSQIITFVSRCKRFKYLDGVSRFFSSTFIYHLQYARGFSSMSREKSMLGFVSNVLLPFSKSYTCYPAIHETFVCARRHSTWRREDRSAFFPRVHRRVPRARARTLIPVAVTFNGGNSSDQNRETWRHEA